MDPDALAEAVEQLYAGAPEDFVATRKTLAARARSDGDRVLATQITALRKPTVSAWALNAMARSRPDLMGDLAEFSASMRAAQSDLDAAAMRDLSRGREELLGKLVSGVEEAAQEEDGRALGAGLLAEVRATFVAAIADPHAEEAVACGCLTRALSYAGLGEVDLSQALAAGPVRRARPSSPPRSTPSASSQSPSQSGAYSAGDSVADSGASDDPTAGPSGDGEAGGDARREAARRAAEREARERAAALTRAKDRLGAAERDLTGLSLAQAEALEVARRAADRRGELTRLLERATREAREAQDAATAAGEALAEGQTARDEAAAEVERLT